MHTDMDKQQVHERAISRALGRGRTSRKWKGDEEENGKKEKGKSTQQVVKDSLIFSPFILDLFEA